MRSARYGLTQAFPLGEMHWVLELGWNQHLDECQGVSEVPRGVGKLG